MDHIFQRGRFFECAGGSNRFHDATPNRGLKWNRNIRSAKAVAAANVESIRSSTPPWPGIRLPEFLIPKRRLTKLSNRSPAWAVALNTSANKAAIPNDPPRSRMYRPKTIAAVTLPPMVPAQVLD